MSERIDWLFRFYDSTIRNFFWNCTKNAFSRLFRVVFRTSFSSSDGRFTGATQRTPVFRRLLAADPEGFPAVPATPLSHVGGNQADFGGRDETSSGRDSATGVGGG